MLYTLQSQNIQYSINDITNSMNQKDVVYSVVGLMLIIRSLVHLHLMLPKSCSKDQLFHSIRDMNPSLLIMK